MSYLLSVGEPTAAIAIYYPTTSGWLGDFTANAVALEVAQQLLEHQRDFDFVDEESLQSGLKVEAEAMVNRSGQRYRTIVIPPVKVISQTALAQLENFARAGGTVIFVERLPELIADRTYLHAANGPTSLPWATLVTAAELSVRSQSLLPQPDVILERSPAGTSCPAVKYHHRRLADGEVYYLFNESPDALDLRVLLEGVGTPQYWDATTGSRCRPAAWTRDGKYVRLPLTLDPYEARTIVLGPESSAPKDIQPMLKETADTLVIEGDWSLAIAGKHLHGPLKSWSDYGEPGYSGTVKYTKEFSVPRRLAEANGNLWLDLGDVKYSARVVLNGKDLGTLAWRPFRWAVGDSIRTGPNVLEIEVTNTAANELAGNPDLLADLEQKGWLRNSYIQRYLPFDREMVPSGLFGPVRLVVYGTTK